MTMLSLFDRRFTPSQKLLYTAMQWYIENESILLTEDDLQSNVFVSRSMCHRMRPMNYWFYPSFIKYWDSCAARIILMNYWFYPSLINQYWDWLFNLLKLIKEHSKSKHVLNSINNFWYMDKKISKHTLCE